MFRSTFAVLLGSSFLLAGLSAVGAEPKCPISGGKAKKSASADYNGGKVYFCCGGCAGKFKKDTAKYATKANNQLVVTGQFKQTACPITGKKCKESVNCDVAGVTVCFCCGGCKKKVTDADAKKQLELVFGEKFATAFKAAEPEKKEK